jgi:DNA-binding transcriptional regulator YiaG
MRCVVCGRLPSEGCNDKTHAAHDRMWLDLPYPPMLVDADELRLRRIERGLSVREVAEALGSHASTVQKWETEGFAPTIRMQRAWRDLLTE